MFFEVIKNKEKFLFNQQGDCMAGIYLLTGEGVIYALYEEFLKDIHNPKIKGLSYNALGIDKLENDFLKLYYCISQQDEKYSLIATKTEIIKITNFVYKFMDDDNWQKIRFEFDGETFDITVDEKPYF